jgi:tetratricopeptide (TPR) repeat protein
MAYRLTGRPAEALRCAERSLDLRRQIGDQDGQGWSLVNTGIVYTQLGQQGKAVEYYQQALSIWEAQGYRVGMASWSSPSD